MSTLQPVGLRHGFRHCPSGDDPLPCLWSLGGVYYYVDGVDGDDAKNGLNWANAVQTIQQAIDLSNATIDWAHTPKLYNHILVRPAVYPEKLSFPYYCHLIGLGIRGTDTMAKIHPTTGSPFTGTMLGTSLFNLWMEINEALPVLDVDIGNNSLVEDCTFAVVAAVNPTGIDTENATHLTVKNCDFESDAGVNGFAYGIYNHGGLDKYANKCRYFNNRIEAITRGILVEANCQNAGMVIEHNSIYPYKEAAIGGAGLAVGIEDLRGLSLCYDNFIVATDCINHAGGARYLIANHEVEAGGGAVETGGSS